MSDRGRGAPSAHEHVTAEVEAAEFSPEASRTSRRLRPASSRSRSSLRGDSKIGKTRSRLQKSPRGRLETWNGGTSSPSAVDDAGDAGRGVSGEVVPYHPEWAVILRDEPSGQLVLYNAENKTVAVRRSPSRRPSDAPVSGPGVCALCRRPYGPNATSQRQNANFMDANYFRLLAISTQAQDNKTPPALPGGEHPHPQFSRPDADVTDTGGDSADHVSEGSFNQGYYQRFFNEGPKLGKGLRGSVFRCQHVLDGIPLGEYAVKKVAVGDNHTWLARMLKEVHLLGQFHHNNIIDYKHAWLEHHKLTNFGPEVPCLFILMECANGGNLEEYINQGFGESFGGERELRRPQSAKDYAIHEKERRRRRRLPFWDSGLRDPEPSPSAAGRLNESGGRLLSIDHILSFFIDIAEGLSHLHRHGIIHRDLKPPNLLLNFKDTSDPDEIPTVLLSDFGECEVLAQLTNRHRTGATGTLEFIAPELVKVDKQGKYLPEYSHKADMWSLGILLYYLCFSKLPYQQTDDVDALKEEILQFSKVDFPDENEREPGLAPRVLQELKDLITVLLKPDAASRPSVDDIMKIIGDRRPRMRSASLDPQHGSATPQRSRGSGPYTDSLQILPLSPPQSISPIANGRLGKQPSAEEDRWTDERPAFVKSRLLNAEADGAAARATARRHIRARSTLDPFTGKARARVVQDLRTSEHDGGDVPTSVASSEETDSAFGWSADTSLDSLRERAEASFRRRASSARDAVPPAFADPLAELTKPPGSTLCRRKTESRTKSASPASRTISNDLSGPWSQWDEETFAEGDAELAQHYYGRDMTLMRRPRRPGRGKWAIMHRLLPAPENPRPDGFLASMGQYFAADTASGKAAGLVVAGLMIVSCTATCYPYAPSPGVFYPVVLLALAQLYRPDLFFPLLAPAIYVAFLFVMGSLGMRCSEPFPA